MEVCWLKFSVFALIQLSRLMKCKRNALLYSQLPNNTLLLLSTHPLYFSPHTSEAILSTHCHTSASSVRYLLCPAAFLESCCIFTLTFHWRTAFWLCYTYTTSLIWPQNGNTESNQSFHLGRKATLNDHLNAPSNSEPPSSSLLYSKGIYYVITHTCFSKDLLF